MHFDRRCVSRSGHNKQSAIHPGIALVTAFETSLHPHVTLIIQNVCTSRDTCHDLFRTMPKAVVDHLDDGTVIYLQRISRIQFGQTISDVRLPVRADPHPKTRPVISPSSLPPVTGIMRRTPARPAPISTTAPSSTKMRQKDFSLGAFSITSTPVALRHFNWRSRVGPATKEALSEATASAV